MLGSKEKILTSFAAKSSLCLKTFSFSICSWTVERSVSNPETNLWTSSGRSLSIESEVIGKEKVVVLEIWK